MKIGQSNEKKRLAYYKKILRGSPAYLKAVEQTEMEQEWSADTELYLHTMAPALLSFVSWVLREAVILGKMRLYFLSRDGYQMYRVALRLTELWKLPIECRYLCVSRYSMRVPEYHLRPHRCLDKICVGGIDVTPEKILKRAALTVQESEEIISALGWQDRRQKILNYRQVLELKELLREQPKLFQYVRAHSKAAYENAVAYLQQEGLFSDEAYALVDSGWIGTLQESIQTLIHSRRSDIQVEGFYFGLYELPAGAEASVYHAYYFTPRKGLRRKAHFSNSLFEAICSADEGMTKGYEQKGECSVPQRELHGNPNKEQLRRNLYALERFLIHYDEPWKKADRKDNRSLTEQLFTPFMAQPMRWEAEVYGDSLFADDMLEDTLKKVAAELTEEEIRNQRFVKKLCIVAGLKKAVIHESAWLEGSIVRCGRHVSVNLFHARLYKYFVYVRKQLSVRTGNFGF